MQTSKAYIAVEQLLVSKRFSRNCSTWRAYPSLYTYRVTERQSCRQNRMYNNKITGEQDARVCTTYGVQFCAYSFIVGFRFFGALVFGPISNFYFIFFAFFCSRSFRKAYDEDIYPLILLHGLYMRVILLCNSLPLYICIVYTMQKACSLTILPCNLQLLR